MTRAADPAAAPHPDDPGTPDVPGSSGARGRSAPQGEPPVATPEVPALHASPALPPAWAQDPFLLDEHRWWRPEHVETSGDALLLVQRSTDEPTATMLLAAGPAPDVAALVRAHGVRTHRFAWVETAALDVLHLKEVTRLGLTPNRTGWEWLVTDRAPAEVAAEAHVRELDPVAEGDAIRACLALANPTTEADPSGAGERWWGVVDPEEPGVLAGVVGAAPRSGRPGGAGSAHLHGLGVRPGGR
ncbi:hypothetical protein EBM89_19020, partial [Cellulomonas triticagri]